MIEIEWLYRKCARVYIIQCKNRFAPRRFQFHMRAHCVSGRLDIWRTFTRMKKKTKKNFFVNFEKMSLKHYSFNKPLSK